MKVKYNKGGKSPVDPPKTSPDSQSKYNIGNMYFQGEEADRLIAFDEYLVKEFPDLDLFQRAEQVEKFLGANAHKSNDAMNSYSVDPALKEVKATSIEDQFGSVFGGSDPFADDPDIQRMREEAANRDKKKGRRKRFKQGGKLNDMKIKYGKGGSAKEMKEYMSGGSAKEMYASGGMLKALLADPKQRAMAEEILAEMGAKIPEYEHGGKKTYEEGGEVTGPMVVVKGKKGDGVREVRTLEKGGEELVGMVSDRMQRMMINGADANLNNPEFRADYEKVMGMIGKGGSVADVSKALTYLEGTNLGTQMTKGNPTFMEDLRKDIFKMQYAIPSKDSEKGFRYLSDEEAAEYENRKGKKF